MSLINFINNASANAVRSGLIEIKNNYLPNSEFLPNTNPLKLNTDDAIKNHFNRTTLINPDDAKAYLAASALLHCFDGWNYLSSSIENLLKGDNAISIHLAYYAELRATSSFLATEGIGVFNYKHFCISSSSAIIGNPSLRPNNDRYPTHTFVWDALDAWIKNTAKPSDALKYFSFSGKTFEEWINHIPIANTIATAPLFLRDWLKDWSFDINRFKDDRSDRNIFSYRPSVNRDFNLADLSLKLNQLNNFWKALEPSTSNRFSLLDKYLFKILINKIHSILVQSGSRYTINQFIDDTFTNARLSIDISLKQIIINDIKHSLIENAKDSTIDSSGYPKPFSIIARAILMLRLSSGATAFMLKHARISKAELDFYWNVVGVEYGFWHPSNPPANFTELWSQINDSILDLEDWLSNFSPDINLKSLHDINLDNQACYTQFNRASFWGTGF